LLKPGDLLKKQISLQRDLERVKHLPDGKMECLFRVAGKFSSSLSLLFILQYCFFKIAPLVWRQRTNEMFDFKRLSFLNNETEFSI
jgi:hypothetical protein